VPHIRSDFNAGDYNLWFKRLYEPPTPQEEIIDDIYRINKNNVIKSRIRRTDKDYRGWKYLVTDDNDRYHLVKLEICCQI